MKTWIALLAALAFVRCLPARADETAAAAEEKEPAAAESQPAESAPPILPLALHCGTLVGILPAASAETVDMAKMLADDKLEPIPGTMPDTTSRTPSEGWVFAVAEIRLAPKRSVGRTDFVLRHGSTESKCLALGEGAGAFDERAWVLEQGTVRLLFEVPQDTRRVSLAYGPELAVRLPPPPEIPFGEPSPAISEPAAEPAAAAPAEPLPAEKPKPAPAPKPAVAAQPAEKPKPAPQPKKPEPPAAGIPLF